MDKRRVGGRNCLIAASICAIPFPRVDLSTTHSNPLARRQTYPMSDDQKNTADNYDSGEQFSADPSEINNPSSVDAMPSDLMGFDVTGLALSFSLLVPG